MQGHATPQKTARCQHLAIERALWCGDKDIGAQICTKGLLATCIPMVDLSCTIVTRNEISHPHPKATEILYPDNKKNKIQSVCVKALLDPTVLLAGW